MAILGGGQLVPCLGTSLLSGAKPRWLSDFGLVHPEGARASRGTDPASGESMSTRVEKRGEQVYNFALILSGVSEPEDWVENALYEAGCDDALLAFRAGTAYLEFDRQADDLEQGILTAVRDVEQADERLAVVRVEPGDLATAAEIARRAHLTREYVRLLAEGKRGEGYFPAPQSGITGKTLVWSWAEVARWLLRHGMIEDASLIDTAETIRDINDALAIRHDSAALKRRRHYLRQLKLSDAPRRF